MYRSFTAEQYRQHLGLRADYTVDGLLCYGTLYEEKMLAALQTCFENLGLDVEPMMLAHPFLRFARELQIGDKKLWFTIAYGGAWLSEYTHWACLFGSKKNILVGSCGGLKPGMNPGDFIVPDSSFAEESSARIYNRDSAVHHSDADLSASVRARLEDGQAKIWSGPMVTCQAMIGESMEDVERWSKDGYFGVEMEASTLFAVSKHFNVPAAAVVYVGDNLIEQHNNMSADYASQAHIRELNQQKQLAAAIEELLS